MIVYGLRSVIVGTEPISHTCSACRGESLTFIAYQNYAHIYWIPFFPVNKTIYLKCPKCSHLVEHTDMSEEQKSVISTPLSKLRTPVWTFSFFAVAAIIVLGKGFIAPKKLDQTALYRMNPRPGDFMVVQGRTDPERPFVVVRVNNVEGQSLDLSYGNFAYATLEEARRDIEEHAVYREPSSGGAPGKNEYFGKRAAMAKSTFARLDVRYVDRPGE